MRLLLVSFIDDNAFSGMGKWTHQVAHALRERDHSVTCWWNNDFPRLRSRGRWSVLGFPPLLAAKLVRARGLFDAVVLHEPTALAWAALRRVAPSLPPLVAMCHNVESKVHHVLVEAAQRGMAEMSLGRRVKPLLVRTWQSDGALRLADEVVCLSREDARWLAAEVGVPGERITVTANGVESERFTPVPRPMGASARVLFVGGWLEVKGRRLMAAAWPKVLSRAPGATLTLVGTGASAEAVLRDFPVSSRGSIRVVPRVDAEEGMVRELAGHGMFCMPSVSEGSPLALLEAMASGLPSVVTRVGGIPDLVTDGVEGCVVPPLDTEGVAAALVGLVQDDARSRRMGEAARQRARQYTWDATAAALERAAARALVKVPAGR